MDFALSLSAHLLCILSTVLLKLVLNCFFISFLFIHLHSETNCLDTGLLIEVWNKGLIWDKAMGHYWLPLHQVPYSNEVLSCIFTLFSIIFFYMTSFRVQTLGQNWEGSYCLRIAHLPSNDLNVFSGLTDYNVAWWVRPHDLQLGWWQHARRICSEDRNRKEREESRSSLCVTNP